MDVICELSRHQQAEQSNHMAEGPNSYVTQPYCTQASSEPEDALNALQKPTNETCHHIPELMDIFVWLVQLSRPRSQLPG
eukprot:93704-Pelagomonas_calceolata.AAC.1